MPRIQKCCWLVTIVLVIICLLPAACTSTKTEIEPTKPPPTTTRAETTAPIVASAPSSVPAVVKTTEPPTTVPELAVSASPSPTIEPAPTTAPAPVTTTPPVTTTTTPTPTIAPTTTPPKTTKPSSGGGGGGGGGGGSSTTTPSDTTPPTVTSVSPSAGATEVGLDISLTAVFSEAINSDTISVSSFTLKQGTSPINGTVSYDSSTKTATFAPQASLLAGKTYTAALSTDVKDTAGNGLSAVSWSFTTVAPPVVSSKNPDNLATSVPINALIKVVFSKPMKSDTINDQSFSVKDTTALPGTVLYNGANNTATFTPSINMNPNSTYKVTLTGNIEDITGIPLAPVSWNFTTGAEPTRVEIIGPNTAAPGEIFVVEIQVSNVTDLFAFQCTLKYDSDLIQLENSTDFPGGVGQGVVGSLTFENTSNFKDEHTILEGKTKTSKNITANGYLAKLQFKVVGTTGTSSIIFDNIDYSKLFDFPANEIPCEWVDGSVTIQTP